MFNIVLPRHSYICFSVKHECNLSFSASAGFNYQLHDYFQLVYIEWTLQLGLLKPWWNFSSVYRDEIFPYNRNSIFTLLSLHMWKETHHGLTSWNFSPGCKSPYTQPLSWSFLRKELTIFAKGSILEVWLGSECSPSVRDNYLSLDFPAQPY